MKRHVFLSLAFFCIVGIFGFLQSATQVLAETPPAMQQTTPVIGGVDEPCEWSAQNSPYIPLDSWIYSAALRLYSLGYVDKLYLDMRPWTRSSLQRELAEIHTRIDDAQDYGVSSANEAEGIYDALLHEFNKDGRASCSIYKPVIHTESVYTNFRGISGTPLHDSFHLGQTIVNDYGRPYENGLNNYTGASGYLTAGRFVLYARGELQAAPSATGYSYALSQRLAQLDSAVYPIAINPATGMPYIQATIPQGPINTTTRGRVVEAYAAVHVLAHEFSFGKQDEWIGPAQGASMAYSNNAESVYAFHINRAEPLYIPYLSKLTGPFRYEFLIGPLKGHTYPNAPWVHVEKVSFKPTVNFELGFERTVVWGGEGHEPITMDTFLRSFFSLTAQPQLKLTRKDPGARFGAFDFSYRLPFVRNWLTLYTDSEVHDDVSPIDAPRRAAIRPGLYLSHLPGLPQMDIRAEAAYSNVPISLTGRVPNGQFMYFEGVQQQGYTNNGQLYGDWVGRAGNGGQAWITYHLSGNESIRASYRRHKVASDFVPGGTTLNDVSAQVVKRVGRDFEINGSFAYERWKAPIYLPKEQTVTTTSVQLTWYPGRKVSF